jgi:hypothetical protein
MLKVTMSGVSEHVTGEYICALDAQITLSWFFPTSEGEYPASLFLHSSLLTCTLGRLGSYYSQLVLSHL